MKFIGRQEYKEFYTLNGKWHFLIGECMPNVSRMETASCIICSLLVAITLSNTGLFNISGTKSHISYDVIFTGFSSIRILPK